MIRKWFSIAALVAAAFLELPSCGFNQHLVSIEIQPSGGATFGAADPSLFVDFTATGTYEHPPATKDLTNQVTWKSDTPQVATVTSGGVVSPNTNCGSANVFATFYDSPNLVTSNAAHIVVDGPASLGCTPAGSPPVLTVNFGGTGTGTVTSSPAGIDCSYNNTCSAPFTAGTLITLTGTPTGSSTSVTWSGCSSPSGNVCSLVLESSTTVTATFQ